jgi:hypothetical protein
MTLMSSISKLTTWVDQLAGEANVTKARLDAKVALADAAVVTTQAEQAAIEAARDEAAAHAADATTHLATVKAGVTYQGISAILADKAVTAVDVFVYDTSLDSDGGVWRKRCQHTSWYNEPLNTATPRVRYMPWFSGVWRQLALIRQNGVAALYLDGVQTDSWSAPESLSVPDAPLFIGKNTIFGSGFYSGKLALLRISAIAPTLDQIRKTYEDERKLLMPDAQCTLFGTSDAVTALANDPKTNLLHVGTSQGRSVFDGLLRVANTETPVGTAISAVNGLIAEQ